MLCRVSQLALVTLVSHVLYLLLYGEERSVVIGVFFFFKQKTAYEMRISDWSSDVCSSDLLVVVRALLQDHQPVDAVLMTGLSQRHELTASMLKQIGRASCRERVCQYV